MTFYEVMDQVKRGFLHILERVVCKNYIPLPILIIVIPASHIKTEVNYLTAIEKNKSIVII